MARWEVKPPGDIQGEISIPYTRDLKSDWDSDFTAELQVIAKEFIALIRRNPCGIYASDFSMCTTDMFDNPNTAAWLLTFLGSKYTASMSLSKPQWKIMPVGRPTLVELENMLLYGSIYASPGWIVEWKSGGGAEVFPNHWYNILDMKKITGLIDQKCITQVSAAVFTKTYRNNQIWVARIITPTYQRKLNIAYYADGIIIDIYACPM